MAVAGCGGGKTQGAGSATITSRVVLRAAAQAGLAAMTMADAVDSPAAMAKPLDMFTPFPHAARHAPPIGGDNAASASQV